MRAGDADCANISESRHASEMEGHMHHLSFDVNWIAIAVATVAFVVLGGLWFTVFFRRVYEISRSGERTRAEVRADLHRRTGTLQPCHYDHNSASDAQPADR